MEILHDIHNHTLFSSCCYDPEATMAAFVDKAYELGHRVLGISNHLWDERVAGSSSWYRGQTINYGFEAKYAIPSDTHGVRVLFGVESEYCGRSDTLGMSADTAERFDYLLIPHTHTHMRGFVIDENPDVLALRRELADRAAAAFPEFSHEQAVKMISTIGQRDLFPLIKEPTVDYLDYVRDFMFDSFERLMANPEFIKMAGKRPTLIAHPFSPCGESAEDMAKMLGRLDRDRLFADFRLAAELNVAMDVNIAAYRFSENGYLDDPMVSVMRVAKAAGCKFAFGTDSHSVEGLEKIRRGDAIADAIGITENDLVDFVK